MLCVTGSEQTTTALRRRLQTHAELQEVRLDLLERVEAEALDLLGSQTIATCRSTTEGGGFVGSEEQRCEVIERSLDRAPGYVDLELSTPAKLLRRLFERRGRTKLILSWHPEPGIDVSRPEQLQGALRRMSEAPADLLKIAWPVKDAAELSLLLDALAAERRPVIRIGVGDAGLLSRVLYRRFGSPWTYVVADGARRIAAGQLTVAEAERFRVGDAEHLTPLALVGGPQVLTSPGLDVYNRIFVRRRQPFVYLPVITDRPAATLSLLERLGFGGCSVTMPAKEALVSEMAQLQPPADRIGAINTVLLSGQRIGSNTDEAAVRQLLHDVGSEPALVLGAGGAARAAVVALTALGCEVTVASRKRQRAEQLARQLGGRAVSWDARGDARFAVLVNATPCGADGREDPWPEQVDDWLGRTLLDAVVPPPSIPETALVKRVRSGGGMALDGRLWWAEQGAVQLEALAGQRCSAATLRKAFDDAIRG